MMNNNELIKMIKDGIFKEISDKIKNEKDNDKIKELKDLGDKAMKYIYDLNDIINKL